MALNSWSSISSIRQATPTSSTGRSTPSIIAPVAEMLRSRTSPASSPISIRAERSRVVRGLRLILKPIGVAWPPLAASCSSTAAARAARP